jgi:prepilin-type N-terminal cleavage/methylation domain-containing protein
MQMQKNRRGFTVIELLAVICVLSILVFLALPRYLGYTKDAKFTQLIHDAKLLEEAATRYYLANGQWPRASDAYYTKDQILAFSQTVYDSSGHQVDLDPDGHYYDIDFKALGRYITIQSGPKNFILENPEGAVYVLDPTSNTRLAASEPVATEPQPIRQPDSGEIPIRTPEELAKIGVDPAYPLSGKYILMANLDLSSYSSGEGWNPIGSSNTPFTGQFDGNGLVIKNLTINRPSTNYQGLFGYTGNTTKLSNIGLENVSVTGQSYTGGLVGLNNYGAITNSYSTGSVTGVQNVGGLVGYNFYGDITSSYSTGSVTGTGYDIGGLVGMNYSGTITGSYSTGSVTGNAFNTGGLVGDNTGDITNSYSTGSVTGAGQGTGGLVGNNDYGTITSSYSTGSVTNTALNTGGLVGVNYGAITNSYSTGSVSSTTGNSHTGGLVGYNYSGTITNSYWDTQTSGITTSAGGTGKTTVQMKQYTTFSGWNFTNIWAIEEGVSYPYLRSNEQIPHPGTSQ